MTGTTIPDHTATGENATRLVAPPKPAVAELSQAPAAAGGHPTLSRPLPPWFSIVRENAGKTPEELLRALHQAGWYVDTFSPDDDPDEASDEPWEDE